VTVEANRGRKHDYQLPGETSREAAGFMECPSMADSMTGFRCNLHNHLSEGLFPQNLFI